MRCMGRTAYAALVLLAFGEATGYELKQRADRTLRFFFNAPAMSQLYTELDRLASAGLVASTDAARGAQESRRFALTDAGRGELRRWLADDPLPDTVFKSHLALRIVVGHLIGPERLAVDVATERDRIRRSLDELDVVLGSLDPQHEQLGWAWLVANWGDRYYRDMIARLDELADLLDDTEARRPFVVDHPLDGSLVTLVPVSDLDDEGVQRLREIHRQPEIIRVWGEPSPAWPDDPGVHGYAVVDRDGAVAGFVQWAEEEDPQYRHAGIDIFVDAGRHGTGLGTDTVRTLLAHLVGDRGHHRVVIDPAADNAAAIACYRKAGFREVGVMHAYEQGADGSFHDGLLMEYVAEGSLGRTGRGRSRR